MASYGTGSGDPLLHIISTGNLWNLAIQLKPKDELLRKPIKTTWQLCITFTSKETAWEAVNAWVGITNQLAECISVANSLPLLSGYIVKITD